MRKYQQLCLVVISLISITCLLVYRNENGRLISALYFFRSDDVTKAENHFDYINPLPAWQRIGNGFHAYSSYWHNESLAQSGEIVTLVVGLRPAIVSFNCTARMLDGRSVPGKFGFIREDVTATITNDLDDADDDDDHEKTNAAEDFVIYKFICKIPQRMRGTPKTVEFTDLGTKSKLSIGVHNLADNVHRHQLVACVNLVLPDSGHFAESTANQLDYFYHHDVLGMDEFIVYDNVADTLSAHTKRQLLLNDIRVNVFPFNFPFELRRNDALAKQRVRRILAIDCELRTLNVSTYFVMTEMNEYLYADSYLRSGNSTFLLFDQYAYPEHNRFEILTNTVCLNRTSTTSMMTADSKRLVSDNLFVADRSFVSDPQTGDGRFQLYRPKMNLPDSPSIRLPKYRLFVNRYVECRDVDPGKLALQHTWPASIELQMQHSFMWFIAKMNGKALKMRNKFRVN